MSVKNMIKYMLPLSHWGMHEVPEKILLDKSVNIEHVFVDNPEENLTPELCLSKTSVSLCTLLMEAQ